MTSATSDRCECCEVEIPPRSLVRLCPQCFQSLIMPMDAHTHGGLMKCIVHGVRLDPKHDR